MTATIDTTTAASATPFPRIGGSGSNEQVMAWVRARALDALASDSDVYTAFCRMHDDLQLHAPDHPAPKLASMQFLDGTLQTADDMRKFIQAHCR